MIIFVAMFCLLSCSKKPKTLFRIDVDGQYGYIDSLGREVIQPQYIMAGHFHNGLAAVKIDGKYGYTLQV